MARGRSLASVPQGLSTRDEIVRVGMDLIGTQGFHHTGLDQVLRTAGVPKGSFYHYFPSKEDFGLAVIDAFASAYDAQLQRFLGDASVPPLARIRAYLEAGKIAQGGDGCARGCLIGNLGLEMASQHERFRARLEAIFCAWEARFAACFEAAQAAGALAPTADPRRLAAVLLSGWEGAILRAKVTKSTRPLADFIAVFCGQLLTGPP